MFCLQAHGFTFVDWDYLFILYACKQAVMIDLDLYHAGERLYCNTRDLENEYYFYLCLFVLYYVVMRRKYLHNDLYQNHLMFKFIN